MEACRGVGRIVAGFVLAAGLGACASAPEGLRHGDGSYYAGAGDGRGDYYVGRSYDNVRYVGDPFFDDFYWLHGGGGWYDGWYGSPFYGYGGYCSVRYRYCPPGGWGWADPFPRYDFQLFFGDPWRHHARRSRDGWYDARPHERWRPRPRTAPAPGDDADARDPVAPRDTRPPRRAEERTSRRPRDATSMEGDEPPPRYPRAAPSRREAPRREPPPRSEEKDGN